MTHRTLRSRISRRAFSLAGTTLGAAMIGASRLGYTGSVFAQQATPWALPVKDAYTFLVGGLDTRTVEEDENTDVIMIARVDVANGRMRAISIPRDLLVEIPGYGQGKINSAYNRASKDNDHDWNAGAALFAYTVSSNFGLVIDGVITTNFRGLEGVVDALGGVEVINPYDVADEEYPTEDYGMEEIFFPEGPVTLNGEDALKFCRTRHMDFDEGRVMRQHLVLTALLEAAQRPENVTRLPQIVEASQKFVTTNIPLEVQGQLIQAASAMSPMSVEWGTVVEFLWGETLADGGWNYMTDWSYLPGHVRGWLGAEAE